MLPKYLPNYRVPHPTGDIDMIGRALALRPRLADRCMNVVDFSDTVYQYKPGLCPESRAFVIRHSILISVMP